MDTKSPELRLAEAYDWVAKRRPRDYRGLCFEEALQDCAMLLLTRPMWLSWHERSIAAWLLKAIRKRVWESYRRDLGHSVAIQRFARERPPVVGLDVVCDLRRKARSTWSRLTTVEKQVVYQMHILEDDIRSRDVGTYTRRIRIAAARLQSP